MTATRSILGPLAFVRRRLKPLKEFLRRAGVLRRLRAPDRQLLEKQIIPLLRSMLRDGPVLLVGVDWYTQSYPRLFKTFEVHTIDSRPEVARFGSARHYTATLGLDASLPTSAYQLVVAHGVLGYGTNTAHELLKFIHTCRDTLQEGGILALGWRESDVDFDPHAATKGILRPHQQQSKVDAILNQLDGYNFALFVR